MKSFFCIWNADFIYSSSSVNLIMWCLYFSSACFKTSFLIASYCYSYFLTFKRQSSTLRYRFTISLSFKFKSSSSLFLSFPKIIVISSYSPSLIICSFSVHSSLYFKLSIYILSCYSIYKMIDVSYASTTIDTYTDMSPNICFISLHLLFICMR